MEERKYTFYDRYQKVKYANITVEELEVLNISYNKEHYMFDQQHQRNNTVLFCGLESENGCATDFIADSGRDIASDITTEIFFKELFSDLTEKEKKIVSDYFIMGKQVKETAAELGISTRQVSRDKNSALAKMLKRMKAAGYESYTEAAGAFLQESDYIPSLNFTVFFRKPDCLHFRKRTPVNRICKRSLKNFISCIDKDVFRRNQLAYNRFYADFSCHAGNCK